MVQPTITGYTLTKRLGSGCCGVVYLARSNKNNKEYAIKVSKDRQYNKDFNTEIRILEHMKDKCKSGLVCIVDHGYTKDRQRYIVMNLVKGKTLKDTLPVTKKQAKEIGIQLVQALQEAQRIKTVHFDLHPGNIIVDLNPTKVYIIDWGFACVGPDECKKRASDPLMSSFLGVGVGSQGDMVTHQPTSKNITGLLSRDVYFLGIIIFLMYNKLTRENKEHFLEGEYDELDVDPVFRDLVDPDEQYRLKYFRNLKF